MATLARQPFAPLDTARLQSLSCLKNRQNAIAGKRKASQTDISDAENVDPALFVKRPKACDLKSPAKSLAKPSSFLLNTTTKTAPPKVPSIPSQTTPLSARPILQPKSQLAKLQTTAQTKSSPIPAPAGRSPTLGKRSGLLSNRKKTPTPYTRVDPPTSSRSSPSTPFSLDAALRGTITNRSAVSRRNKGKGRQSSLGRNVESKVGWFFDIHEDTPDQEMTNLLQHSTCVLDISSDEENERKMIRDRENGCDKENIPPPGATSHTAQQKQQQPCRATNSAMEQDRIILSEMNVSDFYGPGCDATSVVLVDEEEEEEETDVEDNSVLTSFEFAPELDSTLPNTLSNLVDPLPNTLPNTLPNPLPNTQHELKSVDLDKLISHPPLTSSKAAVLQPIHGTQELFDLWESASAKDEAEATV